MCENTRTVCRKDHAAISGIDSSDAFDLCEQIRQVSQGKTDKFVEEVMRDHTRGQGEKKQNIEPKNSASFISVAAITTEGGLRPLVPSLVTIYARPPSAADTITRARTTSRQFQVASRTPRQAMPR